MPPAFQNISSKFENLNWNSFYIMEKLRKSILLQSKKPKFCNVWGLKPVWQKNLEYKPQFFLKFWFWKVYALAWIGYQSNSRKLFNTGRKNLFNIVRLRLVGMLARACFCNLSFSLHCRKFGVVRNNSLFGVKIFSVKIW